MSVRSASPLCLAVLPQDTTTAGQLSWNIKTTTHETVWCTSCMWFCTLARHDIQAVRHPKVLQKASDWHTIAAENRDTRQLRINRSSNRVQQHFNCILYYILPESTASWTIYYHSTRRLELCGIVWNCVEVCEPFSSSDLSYSKTRRNVFSLGGHVHTVCVKGSGSNKDPLHRPHLITITCIVFVTSTFEIYVFLSKLIPNP